MALPFFAMTLFVSAFLLFLVQPMIGKMILPRLGGTPQVWNTCMVFFQTALLPGYGYKHTLSTRLKTRLQLIILSGLLLLPLLLLFAGSFYGKVTGWTPPPGGNPIGSTLFTLATVVGLPFFVVATSAPLLQKWFAETGHPAGDDPYFLYGASNLGSFLSLLAYPFLIERTLWLETQAWLWTYGYTGLVVLVFGCAAIVWGSLGSKSGVPAAKKFKPKPKPEEPKEEAKTEAKSEAEEESAKETAVKSDKPKGKKTAFKKAGSKQPKRSQAKKTLKKETPAAPVRPATPTTTPSESRLEEVTPWRRLRWVMLAAIPSSLMLGVTTYTTTDLSPIPLLWLMPLMLYLLSFVLVFARWPVVWVGAPHTVFVWIQPFTIAGLIILFATGGMKVSAQYLVGQVVFHILAFFVTTMVCHGELAKDRPSTKYLTEFYLWMSVGGMLGGMFNGLLAPLMFTYVVEYTLAIFFAAMVRPPLMENDFLEDLFGGGSRASSIEKPGFMGSNVSFDLLIAGAAAVVTVLSAVGTAFFMPTTGGESARNWMTFLQFLSVGVPLGVSFVIMTRPLRYGLTIGAILLCMGVMALRNDSTIYRNRSYFGILKVQQGPDNTIFGERIQYTTLIHGHIDHGRNYFKPDDEKYWGRTETTPEDKLLDYSRLATTYYHRKGPAGRVMELFNWFPNLENDNSFWSDARMPTTLVGIGAIQTMPIVGASLPTSQLVALWSEPPFATIGLGTGTMASYARPFQHMHYYEIDNKVLRLSVPEKDESAESLGSEEAPEGYLNKEQFREYISGSKNGRQYCYFSYLGSAKQRGAELWVFMGDARLRMAQDYPSDWEGLEEGDDRDNAFRIKVLRKAGGPDNFYHMMVVDAFSSDAIPVHLLTQEAVTMYFQKLVERGILCVHTSNRFVDLVPVVKDIAEAINRNEKRKDLAQEMSKVVQSGGSDLKETLKDKAKPFANKIKEKVPADKSIAEALLAQVTDDPIAAYEKTIGALIRKIEIRDPRGAKRLIRAIQDRKFLPVWDYACITGNYSAPPMPNNPGSIGDTTSEWVIVARDEKFIGESSRWGDQPLIDPKTGKQMNHPRTGEPLYSRLQITAEGLKPGHAWKRRPHNYGEFLKKHPDINRWGPDAQREARLYWTPSPSKGRPAWTDDFSDLVSAIRW
ncbi:MAG: hypothetical protein ACFCD0_21510 [Gemmataceae bacterium]